MTEHTAKGECCDCKNWEIWKSNNMIKYCEECRGKTEHTAKGECCECKNWETWKAAHVGTKYFECPVECLACKNWVSCKK